MNKKINVIYILTKLELGGAQKVCLSLLDGLKKENNFAGLISGSEGVLVNEIKNFDSVFLINEFKREVGYKNFINDIKAFFKIIKILKKLKKDYPNLIVHTHSTKAGLIGRWAAFFARIKTKVHTVHGFGFHEYQNKFIWSAIYVLEFFTALITSQYICVSEYDLNIGKKLLPTFKKKSSLIRAAVDFDPFYPAQATLKSYAGREISDKSKISRNFIIGTVSCFKPQKNLFDLLQAFKLFLNKLSPSQTKNIYLQIIGDGILRKDIETWIFFNNLENNIELLGWQQDVPKFMNNWDVYVMSSLWEGLPCSIIEARLSKLPVISYKISGIPEVIINGQNGFLVNPGDVNEISKKLELIFNNQKLKTLLSNYKDSLDAFNNKSMITSHINLYKQLDK